VGAIVGVEVTMAFCSRAAAWVRTTDRNVEIKIIDPQTGQVVPLGVQGELCTRGYSVMLGYLENDTARPFVTAWTGVGAPLIQGAARLGMHIEQTDRVKVYRTPPPRNAVL
jgi:acyl-CoA synthetase (AMP-forming)/AMP-acid ligase II